jgi:hypothetical protein
MSKVFCPRLILNSPVKRKFMSLELGNTEHLGIMVI